MNFKTEEKYKYIMEITDKYKDMKILEKIFEEEEIEVVISNLANDFENIKTFKDEGVFEE